MPYCPNCGNSLPAGAKFCMECGHAVAQNSVPPSPADFTPAAASQPQAPSPLISPATQSKGRSRTGLILGLAIVAVLLLAALVVLLLSFAGNESRNPQPAEKQSVSVPDESAPSDPLVQKNAEPNGETPEQDSDSTEEDSLPLYNAQGIEVAEITTLLRAYNIVTEAVVEATTDDFAAECSRGNLYDYDGDGYPELVLLYSLDGISLHSAIFRRTDDSASPVCMERELWSAMAGGASGAIFSGTLDTGESVIFLESTSWEGETKVGKDYVYGLADTDIEPLYCLEWFADIDGNLINCWVFDADGELLSRDNTEQFMNIYNAREYYEATYPSDQHGILLADLFSDEAMESYYQ